MSRSLFARLNHRYGRRVDGATRRGFLQATLAASAGLLLGGCETTSTAPSRKVRDGARHIVVIGAGFAGLACGHELKSAGYRVTVLDPRSRVGGRVFSSDRFVKGKNVELGAELVGSNHPVWVAYAKQFGLEFLDVTEDENLEAPIILDGKVLASEQAEKLWEEMDAAFNTLNAQAEAVNVEQPWLTSGAAEIDKTPLSDWWKKLEASDVGRKAIWAQLASDNAVELDRQSTLAMLTAIKAGGGEKYWTESEVYRCKGGNQQLAVKLAEAIGDDNVLLKLAATKVTQSDKGVAVTCSDGRVIEADEVVLTVPPTVWHKIAFAPALPADAQTQMGLAVKYLSALKKRYWKDAGLAPDSLSDGPVSQTWEGTDNQEGDENVGLVAFSGGAAVKVLRESRTDDQLNDLYARALEARYPGYGQNLVTKTFMDWPGDPWTLAGYSFPAPGDVTRCGPTLHGGAGRIHFAGEHTSYKFAGYMEGGLNSGAAVAKRIAVRDGVVKG